MIQIATPTVDKPENEMTTKDYDLETIDLGPLTVEQAMEGLNDTMEAMNDMLKLEVEKNKKLEREVSALGSYLQ